MDNPSIEKNDAIIIYYAGRGELGKTPDSWLSADGKINTLIPHDQWGKTPKGDAICGIPQCTLNMLLSTLASAKGNNIVSPVPALPDQTMVTLY
jgi:hypothetical protein